MQVFSRLDQRRVLLDKHFILSNESHDFVSLPIKDFLAELLLSPQVLIHCLELLSLFGDSFGDHAELPANLVHVEVQLAPALLHDAHQVLDHGVEDGLHLLKSPKAVSQLLYVTQRILKVLL